MSNKSRSRAAEKRDPKTVAFWAFMAVALVLGLGMYWGIQSRTAEVASDTHTEVPDFTTHNAPRLSVLGDSYSAGNRNGQIWPQLFANQRGWYLTNAAKGGGGYVGGGPEKVFASQVEAAVWTKPDVILVVGSRNDQYEPGKVRGAADALFADLKAKAPQAQIVVVGPIWDSTTPPAGVGAANTATRAAAEAAGLRFIDALPKGWLGDPALIQPDGVHPTDQGQRVIADRVDEVVPAVTLPS